MYLNAGHSIWRLTFILKCDYARETRQHSLKEAIYLFISLSSSTIVNFNFFWKYFSWKKKNK